MIEIHSRKFVTRLPDWQAQFGMSQDSLHRGDPDGLWTYYLTMACRAGLTVLGSVLHKFPGGGMTGCVVLAESHIAVHTWPEEDTVVIEVTTCGDTADRIDAFASSVGGDPQAYHAYDRMAVRYPRG